MTNTTNEIENKVVITEMADQEELYEVTFHGAAEDYGFSDETDYLSAVDADEIAKDVAEETGSIVVWEGYKPAWA